MKEAKKEKKPLQRKAGIEIKVVAAFALQPFLHLMLLPSELFTPICTPFIFRTQGRMGRKELPTS